VEEKVVVKTKKKNKARKRGNIYKKRQIKKKKHRKQKGTLLKFQGIFSFSLLILLLLGRVYATKFLLPVCPSIPPLSPISHLPTTTTTIYQTSKLTDGTKEEPTKNVQSQN